MKDLFKRTFLYKFYLDRKNFKRIKNWSYTDQKAFDFYSRYISSDDLVIDVGANIGNKVKIFLELKARVIAVEPQKNCVKFLGKTFGRHPNLSIEACALGSKEEFLEISIASSSTISSMSEQWINSVQESGRFNGHSWNKKQIVKVVSLDHLIQKYGIPQFIKIDVEGYEPEVLKGLTAPISIISFEFTPEYIEAAIRCIKYLSSIGDYVFNYAMGENMEFYRENWMTQNEILHEITMINPESNGDVYAKLLE